MEIREEISIKDKEQLFAVYGIRPIYEEKGDKTEGKKEAVVLCCAKLATDARDYNLCTATMI